MTLINEHLGEAAEGAALVTMPTGTGKTAVIAAAIDACREDGDHFLVVAPWRGIVDQLHRGLDEEVWASLGAERPSGFPRIASLPETSEIETLDGMTDTTVFVATIAKLLSIHNELTAHPKKRGLALGRLRAVFVDEGHYEPALKWSKAIRSLAVPTVLLTATPYRNDEKFFEVVDDRRYRYRHATAVDDGFLREPIFNLVEGAATGTFIRRVVDSVESDLPPGSRIIVRCSSSSAIRRCVEELKALGETVVGVHHTFEKCTDPLLRASVPKRDECDARYWVHQFKLVEGIDDPSFRALAIHDPLGNDRSTIQQIGRILRNPRRSPDDGKAWVYTRDRDAQRAWEAYRTFDGAHGASSATAPALARKLLESQPPTVYFDGRYRQPVDLTDSDLADRMIFPLATRIYRLPKIGQIPLATVVSRVVDEWQRADRMVAGPLTPGAVTVIPYISIRNSPFLMTSAFVEAEFGFTTLWMSKTRLFVYDTQGRTPEFIAEDFGQESREKLSGLMGQDSRLTSVSLDNTDLNTRAIRARTLRAAALEDVASDLTDYTYLCSVAEGYPKEEVRRYLGLSRSRVRDNKRSTGNYKAYVEWLQSLDSELNSAETRSATFDRYAQVSDVPDDPVAAHILLDIDQADFAATVDGDHVPLLLDDYSDAVEGDHFKIALGGSQVEAWVDWVSARSRYELRSPDLQARNFRERATGRELVDAINADQAFRIVPVSPNRIYVHGHFVNPVRPGVGGKPFPLIDIMKPIPELGTEQAGREKGYYSATGSWSTGSVFHVIDRLTGNQGPPPAHMAQHFADLDLLLCGDLNKEIADFIAVQPGRVAFIHAKAGSSFLSASAFHDVVGQATKNVLWLQPHSSEVPAYDWNSDWKLTLPKEPPLEGKKQSKVKRQRVGNYRTSAQKWERVRTELANPNADREVWLVLGNVLSHKALSDAATGRVAQTPEFIQVYALLQSAWSAISQAGGRLRIFCSP